MPRPEKVQAVAEIQARLEGAKAVFLAEYAGLSVQDQQTLRRSLRQGGAEFKVVKMTLARRAAANLDIDTLDELLLGPTGLAFAGEDAVFAAKALRDFAKDHEVFTIKGGLLGREFLTPERINELADIESREVLLAQLLGAMQAPLTNLAGLMTALPRGLATAMQQLIDKMPNERSPSDDSVTEPEVEADDAGLVDESAARESAADEEATESDDVNDTDEVPAVDHLPDDGAEEADATEVAEGDDSRDETNDDEPAAEAEEE